MKDSKAPKNNLMKTMKASPAKKTSAVTSKTATKPATKKKGY